MSGTAPAPVPMMRVCSADRSHDISEADDWVKVCPQCGHNIVEIPIPPDPVIQDPPPPREPPAEPPPEAPPEKPAERFPPGYVDPRPDQPTDLPSDPDIPRLPVPGLICAKVPAHDIQARTEDATLCPQPGCAGTLIELECPTNLEHNVSRRPRDSFLCPVCETALVTPFCTFDPTHSMVGRVAGQTTCPVPDCARRVDRKVYVPPAAEQTDQPVKPPPQVPWWKRVWVWLAGAVLVGAAVAALATNIWLKPRPNAVCAAIPRDPFAALAKANTEINAGLSAEKTLASARLHLQCGATDVGIRLLIHGADDLKNIEAAKTLGMLFDPTAPQTIIGKQPSDPLVAAQRYKQAADLRDPTVRADLERLSTYLAARPAPTPKEAEALPYTRAVLERLKPP